MSDEPNGCEEDWSFGTYWQLDEPPTQRADGMWETVLFDENPVSLSTGDAIVVERAADGSATRVFCRRADGAEEEVPFTVALSPTNYEQEGPLFL